MGASKSGLPSAEEALPGRTATMLVPSEHHVNGNPLQEPFPENMEKAVFAMGCFWGVERAFWQQDGVYTTAVGYAGGETPNPSYEEICSGMTGHTEVVLVVFDPAEISYDRLLKIFWESHDPTQGMRQGMDMGSQYRSAIYCYGEDQLKQALETRDKYQAALKENRYPDVTTEIRPAPEFYYAEHYHQQYLSKEPGGYCAMRGTGVSC